MDDYQHRTDTLNTCKKVVFGKQIQHWLEFQLVDEQGEPLANMPYKAVNDATRAGCVPVFTGQSDEQGVIRLEGLHPLPVILLMDANPFARELQTRRLRAVRPEPERPPLGDKTDLYGPQRAGFSPIEKQAHEAGHDYHYLRIGQLCDGLPRLEVPLAEDESRSLFHFPDPLFAGFTVDYEGLSRRHVLEICPLRAWSLVLHHQPDYSLANAYNLGLMSSLAYADMGNKDYGSAVDLFFKQCLDLSRTPRVVDGGKMWPCLVMDVPFDERYTQVRALDTAKADPPVGDTQLFYAISSSHVLVAWRGTVTVTDIITDLKFRPVEPEVEAGCELAVPCGALANAGKVHLGFRDGYEIAKNSFAYDFTEVIKDHSVEKKLFICGHSLGGALGLVQAAELRHNNPLLYTYGMPRTFTLQAVKSLSEVLHFRHVNDMDPVPSVPPEAALDNYLYDLYGPLGGLLGFSWSVGQLTASNVATFGDPFAHHGEIVVFLKAAQHVQERGSQFAAYRSKDGLGAPYYTTVSRRLPERAKLFLVPSLSQEDSQSAEKGQQIFTQSLDDASRDQYFPPYGNVKKGRVVKGFDHFMSSRYQPYLHNQLLESISPERMQHRKGVRDKFEEQLARHQENIHPADLDKIRAFIELQNLVGRALSVTERMEGGAHALQRFDSIADPQRFMEMVHN